MFGYVERNSEADNEVKFFSNQGKRVKNFSSSAYTSIAMLDTDQIDNPQILFGTENGDLITYDLRKNKEISIIQSPFVT